MIVFDETIANMISNKKVNPMVPGLFIKGKKANMFLVSVTFSNFAAPKKIRLNCTH